MTNRKSQINLQKWLAEVLNKEFNPKANNLEVDPEQFVGTTQVNKNVFYLPYFIFISFEIINFLDTDISDRD